MRVHDYRQMAKLVGCLVALCSVTAPLAALELDVDMQMRVNDWQNPHHFNGTMHLHMKGAVPKEICAYLPLNAPDALRSLLSNRRFQLFVPFQKAPGRGSGFVSIAPSEERPELIRVPTSGPNLTWNFAGRLSSSYDAGTEELFFNDFHPVILEKCPAPGEDLFSYQPLITARYRFSFTMPPQWIYAGVGEQKGTQVQGSFAGPQASFSISPKYQVKQMAVQNLPVRIFYRDKDFLAIENNLEQTLNTQTELLGPFPHSSLNIVETDELYPIGMVGLVTLNRPRQGLFRFLQTYWLNWRHWVLASLTSSQWIGSKLYEDSPDLQWFLGGLNDFVTLQTLRQDSRIYNLFNVAESGSALMSMNYREFQDFTANYLQSRHPDLVLLDSESLQPKLRFSELPSEAFIRQAVAIRHLENMIGPNNMKRLLQQLLSSSTPQKLTPARFLSALRETIKNLPEKRRSTIEANLKQWWTTSLWPDMNLVALDKKKLSDGTWLATVSYNNLTAMEALAEVEVTDKNGRGSTIASSLMAEKVTPDGKVYTGSMVLQEEPDNAVIDPQRRVFDINRFNNRFGWPSVQFFPGNAKGLADDGYTLLWAPSVLRRPAQGVAYGINSALFRYIQSGLYSRFEGIPSDKKFIYSVIYRNPKNLQGFSTELSANRNYEEQQNYVASIERPDVIGEGPVLTPGVNIKFRQTTGDEKSHHQIFGTSLKLKSRRHILDCGSSFKAESDFAPPTPIQKEFSYNRHTAVIDNFCDLKKYGDFGLRLFGGTISTDGEVPSNVLFRPTTGQEDGNRIDIRDLPYSKDIASVNVDFKYPFAFGFLPGDSLILSRQLKWHLFFDHTVADVTNEKKVYQSAGAGLFIPLGGEFMGAGELTIVQPSFDVVFYKNNDGEMLRRPSYLFNFFGTL